MHLWETSETSCICLSLIKICPNINFNWSPEVFPQRILWLWFSCSGHLIRKINFQHFGSPLLWTSMLRVQLHRTPANHLLLYLLFISSFHVVVFAPGVWTHFLFLILLCSYNLLLQKNKLLPILLFIFK